MTPVPPAGAVLGLPVADGGPCYPRNPACCGVAFPLEVTVSAVEIAAGVCYYCGTEEDVTDYPTQGSYCQNCVWVLWEAF